MYCLCIKNPQFIVFSGFGIFSVPLYSKGKINATATKISFEKIRNLHI
jgi:hypothetical protein